MQHSGISKSVALRARFFLPQGIHHKKGFCMKRISLFFIMLLISNYALADSHRFVIASNCLLTNISYQKLAATEKLSLISITPAQIDKLTAQKNKLPNCGSFIDVTLNWKKHARQADNAAATFLIHENPPHESSDYSIQYPKQVNRLLNNLKPTNLSDNLTELTQFEDRYSKSSNGVEAANWFVKQATELTKASGRTDVDIQTLDTDGYLQPSVIIKVGTGDAPAVVIGAHMDTLKKGCDWFGSNCGAKPGADDDGSGSVTVLEALRLVLNSGYEFKHPLYFIWYAAEEQGLVGSQQVVAMVEEKNIPIKAVLHFDLTGYAHKKDMTIWLMRDNTSAALNKFMEDIINTYVKRPIQYTQCGYGCSDHASWNDKGYVTTFAAEAKMENSNPNMHSPQDTIEKLSIEHMTDYAKIATAFAIELAQPKQKYNLSMERK